MSLIIIIKLFLFHKKHFKLIISHWPSNIWPSKHVSLTNHASASYTLATLSTVKVIIKFAILIIITIIIIIIIKIIIIIIIILFYLRCSDPQDLKQFKS